MKRLPAPLKVTYERSLRVLQLSFGLLPGPRCSFWGRDVIEGRNIEGHGQGFGRFRVPSGYKARTSALDDEMRGVMRISRDPCVGVGSHPFPLELRDVLVGVLQQIKSALLRKEAHNKMKEDN